MPAKTIRFSFIKLHVPDMEEGLAFWRDAFGFAVTGTFDEPEFLEHIMTLPGQEGGPSVILLQYRDGRDVTVGPGHGPVGLECDDIVTTMESALAAGAEKTMDILDLGPVRVVVIKSPQGHEIELLQMAAPPE